MSIKLLFDSLPQDTDDQYQSYRSVSRSAVLSMIFGLLSFLALMFPAMLVVPMVGFVMGLTALWGIRRLPNELTGLPIAVCGMSLCGLLLVGSLSTHITIYVTEVPEGYRRISFYELQSRPKRTPARVPKKAWEFDGKKIFVKGYVHPGLQGTGQFQVFTLVPDMGTCCFGGEPALTDKILVTLRDPHKIVYNRRKRKLGGILKINKNLKSKNGKPGYYYQLDADYLK